MDPDTSYPPRLFEHELREATLIGQLVSCPAVELSTAPVQGLAMALVEGNNVSVSVAGEICDVKCLLSELLRIQIAGWRCDLTVSAVALDLGGDSSLVDLIDASPETDDEAGTLAFVNEELGHVLEVWVRTEAQAIRILESAFAVTPNLSQKDQVAVFTLRKHRNGNPDSAITSRLVIRFPVLDMIRTLKSELEARRSEKDAQLNQSIQMKGPSEVKSAALGLVGNKVAQLEAALALEKAAHQETINYFTSELQQRAELINSLEGQVRDAAKSNTEEVDHSINTSALLEEKLGIISTLMAEAEELKAARQKSNAALAAEILAHQESIQRYTSKLADKSYEMESMKTELTNLKSTAALSPNTSKEVSLNQISIHSERNSKGVAGVLGQSLPSPPPEAPTLPRLSTPEMRSMSPAGPPTSPAPSNPYSMDASPSFSQREQSLITEVISLQQQLTESQHTISQLSLGLQLRTEIGKIDGKVTSDADQALLSLQKEKRELETTCQELMSRIQELEGGHTMTPPTETFRELEVNTQKLQFLAQDLETSHNERGRLSTRISELEKEVSRLQGVETRLQSALVELDAVCKVKNTYSARIAELDLRLEMVKSELIEFKKKAIKEEDGGGEPEVKALKAKYGKLKEELMLTQVVLEERSRELDDIKRLIKEAANFEADLGIDQNSLSDYFEDLEKMVNEKVQLEERCKKLDTLLKLSRTKCKELESSNKTLKETLAKQSVDDAALLELEEAMAKLVEQLEQRESQLRSSIARCSELEASHKELKTLTQEKQKQEQNPEFYRTLHQYKALDELTIELNQLKEMNERLEVQLREAKSETKQLKQRAVPENKEKDEAEVRAREDAIRRAVQESNSLLLCRYHPMALHSRTLVDTDESAKSEEHLRAMKEFSQEIERWETHMIQLEDKANDLEESNQKMIQTICTLDSQLKAAKEELGRLATGKDSKSGIIERRRSQSIALREVTSTDESVRAVVASLENQVLDLKTTLTATQLRESDSLTLLKTKEAELATARRDLEKLREGIADSQITLKTVIADYTTKLESSDRGVAAAEEINRRSKAEIARLQETVRLLTDDLKEAKLWSKAQDFELANVKALLKEQTKSVGTTESQSRSTDTFNLDLDVVLNKTIDRSFHTANSSNVSPVRVDDSFKVQSLSSVSSDHEDHSTSLLRKNIRIKELEDLLEASNKALEALKREQLDSNVLKGWEEAQVEDLDRLEEVLDLSIQMNSKTMEANRLSDSSSISVEIIGAERQDRSDRTRTATKSRNVKKQRSRSLAVTAFQQDSKKTAQRSISVDPALSVNRKETGTSSQLFDTIVATPGPYFVVYNPTVRDYDLPGLCGVRPENPLIDVEAAQYITVLCRLIVRLRALIVEKQSIVEALSSAPPNPRNVPPAVVNPVESKEKFQARLVRVKKKLMLFLACTQRDKTL